MDRIPITQSQMDRVLAFVTSKQEREFLEHHYSLGNIYSIPSGRPVPFVVENVSVVAEDES